MARAAGYCQLADAEVVAQERGGVILKREAGRQTALYGCLPNVGRVWRLPGVGRGWKRVLRDDLLMVYGDWLGFAAPTRGRDRVGAANLRTGARTTFPASPGGARVLELVVNLDGTVAWLAQRPGTREVRFRGREQSGSTLAGEGATLDRFLGLELEGCAVTWRVNAVGRSANVPCDWP